MTEVLKENLLLHLPAIINGKNGEIRLFKNKLTCQYFDTMTDTLLFTDILSIRDNCDFSLKNRLIQSLKVFKKNSERQKKLRIVVYSIITKPSTMCQLNILSTIIGFDDERMCTQWKDAINELLFASNVESSRPKSLAVFINPIGGCKKGVDLYNSKVKPIFDLAGIKVQVTVTKRRDEAKEFVIKEQTSQIDGLVCVGGDGMLMELIHGLLLKARIDAGYSDEDHCINSPEFPSALRVGIIAAGSTDSVVYSTVGSKDAITSALHIVKGSSIGLDVLTVHANNNFLRYNMTLMGYGFYGNCVSESEALRWMGPKRYDWLGFKHFLSLTTYYGELKYLPVNRLLGDPRDGNTCYEKCANCSKSDDLVDKGDKGKDWVTVRDGFVAINSFLISCRCKKAPIGPAPYAHLGNGCSDLVIVRECNRLNFLQHLLRSASHDDHFDFDFVETVRVSEFSFTSLQNDHHSSTSSVKPVVKPLGVWNCDGEAICPSNVNCKVHRKLIRLFATGIPNMGNFGNGQYHSCEA